MSTMKRPPQDRLCTRTDRYSWATYIMGAVVTLLATVSPTWPKWQAVVMALALGVCVGTAIRDTWWRKELRSAGQ